MTFYLRACFRRLKGAAVGFVLAGLSGFHGLPGVASAQQQQPSVRMFGPDGKLIGDQGPAVQVKASGVVLDAETRQPLPAFHLTAGTQDRDRKGFEWAETSRVLFANGAFSVTLDKERLEPAVLIDAGGYLPQSSGPIHGLETNLTFLLKKGGGPEGVVLTPDGHPAAGRTVYFSRLKDLIVLEGPKLTPQSSSPGIRSTITSDAGRFSFAPDLDPFAVVVADDSGFAEVRVGDLKLSPEVRLQPWATVEGVLKIGDKPAANETVRLMPAFAPQAFYPRRLPPCSFADETATDSAGRFVFPRVPPIDVKFFHVPKMARGVAGMLPITQITNLTLQPGETRAVTLGGQGRPVTGRVVLKNAHSHYDWQDQVFWIDSLAPPPPDYPNTDEVSKDYAALKAAATRAERQAAQDRYFAEEDRVARQLCAWCSTRAGRQYFFAKRRYALRFAQDGSFRIDDVPGGKYQLTIDLRDLLPNRGQSHSPIIALHSQIIDVPDSPGGRSDAPFDLGVINMIAPLRSGDTAPDFAVKTLDGKPITLSGFKGKFVLLHFWAASNAPSVSQMPGLRETCAAFKDDPRVVMIGLNLGDDPASARAFAASNHLDWTQACLGKWSESAAPDQFGIETTPLVMLIDPNGRVVLNNLRGATIKSTVDVALNAKPQ